MIGRRLVLVPWVILDSLEWRATHDQLVVVPSWVLRELLRLAHEAKR